MTRHKPKERRGSSSERGYDKRWERFRRAFLAANPLCEYCLAQGRFVAASVCDHDLPHEGDRELFWNNTYTALCSTCHNSTKQRLESRYRGERLLMQVAIAKGKG